VGKAERQAWAPKGYACLQEIHRSEADECSHAEETAGDDEGAVGGEDEGGVERISLRLADFVLVGYFLDRPSLLVSEGRWSHDFVA
jgi:hypothetical protein